VRAPANRRRPSAHAPLTTGRRTVVGARALLVFVIFVIFVDLATPAAHAEDDRLVVGTHDPTLAAALSVAVSPRGLSVFELPEPLVGVGDVATARHEASVPGTVAVVWLCDDADGTHALCFCDRDGRLVVKPLTVSAPLSAPDAAAVALSVKMLLGAPGAARAPAPPAPVAPPTPSPAPAPERPAVTALPTVALELALGARLQPVAAQHVGLRVGLAGVYAPAALGHALGLGLGIATGPALDARAPSGRTIDDAAIELFARGRQRLGRPWVELDLGPAVHVLSVADDTRSDVAVVGRAGAVVPLGPALVGVRAGGFYVLTSTTSTLALPRWNGEVLATLGVALW
jgi:hypothetical protein